MGPARKRTKASLSAFTFAKKADLRRLQEENRRQKLAMEIMIREVSVTKCVQYEGILKICSNIAEFERIDYTENDTKLWTN